MLRKGVVLPTRGVRRGEHFFGRENCASRRHTELFLSNLQERYLQVGLQGALVREEHRGGGLTEGCAAVRVSAASAGVEALARGGGGVLVWSSA